MSKVLKIILLYLIHLHENISVKAAVLIPMDLGRDHWKYQKWERLSNKHWKKAVAYRKALNELP